MTRQIMFTLAGLALFSLFLLALGKSPAALVDLVWRGGFGSALGLAAGA